MLAICHIFSCSLKCMLKSNIVKFIIVLRIWRYMMDKRIQNSKPDRIKIKALTIILDRKKLRKRKKERKKKKASNLEGYSLAFSSEHQGNWNVLRACKQLVFVSVFKYLPTVFQTVRL